MTRADVALLVFRTLALWVGSSLPILIVTTLARTGAAYYVGDMSTLLVGGVLAAFAAGLWLAAPWLARATFGGSGEPVTFAVTMQDIPPLACFVVGLLQVVSAIPAGGAWLVVRVFSPGSLITAEPGSPLDRYGAAVGAGAVVQLLVGVTLIVLSRRRTLWTPSDADSPDA